MENGYQLTELGTSYKGAYLSKVIKQDSLYTVYFYISDLHLDYKINIKKQKTQNTTPMDIL